MSWAISHRPVGEHALLVELADNQAVHSLAAHLHGHGEDQLQEIVPGHTTLLLVGSRARPSTALLDGWSPDDDGPLESGTEHTIAVRYDGPDLQAVATECGLSPEAVVARHAAAHYRAAFIGFAPGFAYLLGGDPALRPRRRAEPRPEVPAGACALAGEYSAVYPRRSPGGWQLIGQTDAAMFDPERDPPVLVAPGDRVRFIAA